MISRAHLIWLAVLTAGDMLLGAVCFAWLPARAPIHWNFYGEVNRYGGRFEVALLLPIVVIFMAGMLVLASFAQPSDSPEQSRSLLGRLAIVVISVLVVMHSTLLLRAFGTPIDVPMVFLVVVGLFEILLGNWTGKSLCNPTAAIDPAATPKNDPLCLFSNRIGGRLIVAHGSAIVIASSLCPVWIVTLILLGGFLVLAIVALVRAWLTCRANAAKQRDH